MIEAGIVVDAIICDPPFGTTVLVGLSNPFPAMWERLNKHPSLTVRCVFGSEPFSSALRMSN